MNSNFSKTLQRTDEASKRLIIEVLDGNYTYGFDIDSIYYFEKENRWAVLEFLKCDHPSVRPSTSHPRRYWQRNWRKFASLWRLAVTLNAEFYLINYEDLEHAQAQGRSEREFLIIVVNQLNPTESGGIMSENLIELDYDGFKKWFQALNNRGAI